jgi:hypothetical protein
MINQPLKIQPNVQLSYVQPPINTQSMQNTTGSIIQQNQTNGQNKVSTDQQIHSNNQQNLQIQKQQTSETQLVTEKSNQSQLATQATPRTNLLQQISMSIETCIFSNPIHKNNLRYLVHNIQEAIDESLFK